MLDFVVGHPGTDANRTVVCQINESKLVEAADVDEQVDRSRPELEETDQALAAGQDAGSVGLAEGLRGIIEAIRSVVVDRG